MAFPDEINPKKCPKKQRQIPVKVRGLALLNPSWYKCLISAILLGAISQTIVPLAARGQQTENPPGFREMWFFNQASYTYTYTDPQPPKPGNSRPEIIFEGTSSKLEFPLTLVDPLGRILGCGGTLLPDYTGFSVSVYRANGPMGELGEKVDLTRTELPDIPNNGVPRGTEPNIENNNPYFITNEPAEYKGAYNFLLDPNKGQTIPGSTYVFVVNPPATSIYKQRRIKIEILANTSNSNNAVIRYRASSLDGEPISLAGDTQIESLAVVVENAETQGLNLLVFQFTSNLCQSAQVRIFKTGDRATAVPGDTVIYRIAVKNSSDVGLNNLVVTDTLPLGFKFMPDSVRAATGNNPVTITSEIQGNTIKFNPASDFILPINETLNIVYTAQINNDAQRGSGRNSAIVNAKRIDNGFAIKDGPVSHLLKIRSGILSDYGTIMGRVFVDKNFDGEQQYNEPGIPNAVIYLEDGNRITTDPNGLFSLANVLPGTHTGVLDLSSLPGYTLAPNRKFSERNSQSRLVRLSPGGLVRMNFGVTPTFQEESKK